MNIYLAASFRTQELMRKITFEIEASGRHRVTSRWIHQPGGEQSMRDGVVVDRMMAIQHARQDIEDINNSDVVALFTGVSSSTGGLHWEYGYCAARSKHLVLVGPMVNVFMALPVILEHFDTHEAFVEWVLK